MTLAGTVANVDRNGRGIVTIRVDVPPLPPRTLFADAWQVTLAEPSACGDPTRISRGARVAIAATFATFEGFMNEHATATGGACQ